MTDDLIQELRRFQRYASQLQGIISEVRDGTPQSAEAEDAQGAVCVRVGRDGLPESVSVVRDWQKRRKAGQIADAVLEAYESAVNDLMTEQSRMLSGTDWHTRADATRQEMDTARLPETPASWPEMPQRDLGYTVPRSIDEVAEEMITSFDNLSRQDPATTERVQAMGTDSTRHVTITLAQGSLISCAVDPEWAGKQSSVGLGRAFEEALRDGRSALTQAIEANDADSGSRQLDSLLDEALAILGDPRRATDF
jgi:hypothetical protein